MTPNWPIKIVLVASLLLSGCQTAKQRNSAVAETPTDDEPHFVVKASTNQKPDWAALGKESALLKLEAEPAHKDLWQLTRDHMGLDISHLDNQRVQAQINWYAKHDRYLDRMTARASRYYYYILHQVIDRGMPAEIALLPAIESSYDPFAKSPARAAGPWQFIPSTGDHFGLKRNWWYDGRRDLVASTDAALSYLQYLHDYFDNDWLLALAAYNAGEGTVGRAIKKNRAAGKPTDFWNLPLPRETRAYVPKLIAIAEVFRNPEAYGLSLAPLANEPYFTAIDTGGQIDLARVAELSQVELDEIYKLNPGFNRWATDPEGPHQLLIPVAQAQRFRNALAALDPEERISWARYEIKPGDTLSGVARKFNTTLASIRNTNKIDGSLIRVGQSLLIPSAMVDATEYALSSDQRTESRLNRVAPPGTVKQIHRVERGESLWAIARDYGVSSAQISRWNNIGRGETLQIGKQLVIYQNRSASSTASTLLAQGEQPYRVQKGDNLSRIAERMRVSVQQLMQWNSLSADAVLQPGQELQVAALPENS